MSDFYDMGNTIIAVWIATVVIYLGILGFGVWVVYKLLQHFAVI